MIICRGTNDTDGRTDGQTDNYLPHYSGISSHSKELVLTCGEAQSQQLQSQAFDCIIISDNCNRKHTISSSHRLAQEHNSSQLIRHLFADCGDCDMAHGHIIFYVGSFQRLCWRQSTT